MSCSALWRFLLKGWRGGALLLMPIILEASPTPLPLFEVPADVFRNLKPDSSAQFFLDKKAPFRLMTEALLTADNMGTMTVKGVLSGLYKTSKMDVELELQAQIQKGELRTSFSVQTMDELLALWEKRYAPPNELLSLSPKFYKLSFREGEGFKFLCLLRSQFDYLLVMEIPCPEPSKLEDVGPALVDVQQFVQTIERDSRGRIILQNNKSDVPTYITLSREGEKRRVMAHHPMHDMVWERGSPLLSYSYLDDLSDVRQLPEIKRLCRHPQIKTFLKPVSADIRVRAEGNPNAGFKFVLTRASTGQQIKASLTGKDIVVELGP